FVPNLTFGPPIIHSIRSCTTLPFDIHLMINNPDRLLDDFIHAGADSITFHIEACENAAYIRMLLERLQQAHIDAALSDKPNTPIETVFPYLNQLSMVLIMTVEPGFGGQKLMPQTLNKIATLRKKCATLALKTKIEVDGGIKPENASSVISQGADILVAGSAVFGAKDPAFAIRTLRG
ncbi:MAG TPA: ribulose-phosphate 3-epimerase, partial [Ruminococcaceae bacterium]|nr:ribulose-phosphate 3-epimerase [Oscillospiraceae bacterium]